MMVERPHDHIEELAAAAAIGGSEERNELVAAMAEHGSDCAECRRIVDGFDAVAARLALATEPVPVSGDEEEALTAVARQWSEDVREGSAAVLTPVAERPRWARRPSPPVRHLGGRRISTRVAALAVAAVVALIAGAIGYSLAPNGPKDLRIAAFDTPGSEAVAVAYEPGTDRGWVVASGLDRPPSGRVYELWVQPTPGAAMQPAGVFVPRDGRVFQQVDLEPSFVTLAVSVEPGPNGSRAPTTQPILVQKVSS